MKLSPKPNHKVGPRHTFQLYDFIFWWFQHIEPGFARHRRGLLGLTSHACHPKKAPNSTLPEWFHDEWQSKKGMSPCTGRASLYRESLPVQGESHCTGSVSLYRATLPVQGESPCTEGLSLHSEFDQINQFNLFVQYSGGPQWPN